MADTSGSTLAPRVTHGQPRAALVLDDFIVTEAVYDPNHRVPRHEHVWPSFTLVLTGAFEEVFTSHTEYCVPGSPLAKPATAGHANRYGPHGARCEFSEPPTLSALAGAIGVHPVYLCQAFRTVSGTSPGPPAADRVCAICSPQQRCTAYGDRVAGGLQRSKPLGEVLLCGIGQDVPWSTQAGERS
jgi:hypothetical protein